MEMYKTFNRMDAVLMSVSLDLFLYLNSARKGGLRRYSVTCKEECGHLLILNGNDFNVPRLNQSA
jgi:hypothetical protein